MISLTMLMLAAMEPIPGKKPADEDEIVVTGLPKGASVVEVDFDKVWKSCAECKRALKKLDRLAEAYRTERQTAYAMGSGGVAGGANGAQPSMIGSWQRSSADSVDRFGSGPRAFQTTADGLAVARRMDTSRRTTQEMMNRYASPEMATLQGHMRAFLDQLAPHVVAATEAERKARGARASIIGKKGVKLSATGLVRTDVTKAVIRRLDMTDFTIALPDPSTSKRKSK